MIYKKVLLRERKRHTDRSVSSTPSVNLYGGYPRWGNPTESDLARGVPLGGGGTWGGVLPPPGVPPSRSDMGVPEMGYTPCHSWLRYHPHPHQTWPGYPPPPSDLAGVTPPPIGPGWGTPHRTWPGYPHPGVDRLKTLPSLVLRTRSVTSMWVKRSGCQEVSRCHTRGESEEFIACRRQSMQAQEDPLWLWNPGQTSPEKSKTGASVAPSKGLSVSIFLKKILWKI